MENKMILTQDQIADYQKNGFVLVTNFYDRKTVDNIRSEIEGIHERAAADPEGIGRHVLWEDLPENDAPRIRQLMGSEHVSETIMDITTSPRMTGAMTDLLGDKVELFHSKLMMKAARKGSFTPWHSDWGYWKQHFKTPRLMNAFLAIDESTIENGCIRYVPGSHKTFIEQQVFESSSGFNIGLPGGLDAFNGVPVEMQPGDVAFHDAICIHASEGNRSPKSRIMNTFAYTVINNVADNEQSQGVMASHNRSWKPVNSA
jgi:ectoine hydroxylase-related dioxygenase (phytanoyl-CoA dioxygenase family)